MEPRLLISLVIDNSAAVQGERFDKIKASLGDFWNKIKQSSAKNIELEIIAFNEFNPIVIKSFKDEELNLNNLVAFKMPFLGKAISLAIKNIEKRENYFIEKDVEVYKSWLFVVNDAYNFDELDDAVSMLSDKLSSSKLLYMPFMLSQKKISQNMEPLFKTKRFMRIKENCYDLFFDWFFVMAEKRALAPMGTPVKFDRAGFEGWAIL